MEVVMKKMLYSAMLLVALFGSYSMNGMAFFSSNKPKSDFVKTSKIDYEQLTPQQKAEKFQSTVHELQEAVTSDTQSPSVHIQIKRVLGSAERVENEVLTQVRSSDVKSVKAPRTHVPINTTREEKTMYRLQTINDIANNLVNHMPARLSTNANDAMWKSQRYTEKALESAKKGSA